ncbi:MAG: FAD-dependent oxidoreductase [Lachnospiraceae bacterium]|nr:FAD-dependent oxidoreductase [Lachnospiraceae bacterium]
MEATHYDVIVVGAGMAGLLTAYYLQEQGKRVLVLEAGEVASGQTGRTTAKITSQHGLKYSKLIEDVGLERARIYARVNEAAIKEFERLIKSKGIECGFEKTSAYIYTTEDAQILKQEARAAASLGIDAFFTLETELPFAVKGAVCFRNQAQFSALEFVEHISSELEILTHTQVLKVRGEKVITKGETYTADKIVLATHYPMINVPGFYFLRQHQERSYVLALEGCEEIKGMYLGIDVEGLSFRQQGDVLLLGGSSHRTGVRKGENSYASLRRAAKEYFPKSREKAHWSAQDCMPHDGIPFIGRYSIFTPNLYVITGFQKWGMTSSMVAALILRDEVCGVRNPYAKLFSPWRLYFRAGIRNLLMDVGESVRGLTRGMLLRKTPRCSHMGCELVWNPDEESWDCPCHGSRFERDGQLLDNPAKRGVNNIRN